jgi:hypothetical protein
LQAKVVGVGAVLWKLISPTVGVFVEVETIPSGVLPAVNYFYTNGSLISTAFSRLLTGTYVTSRETAKTFKSRTPLLSVPFFVVLPVASKPVADVSNS